MLVGWLLIRAPCALQALAINTLAPFVLNSKLKPLMLASPAPARFIVNVSAMEGKFYRRKTAAHPHTNMAKAALNMMTRTSAQVTRHISFEIFGSGLELYIQSFGAWLWS